MKRSKIISILPNEGIPARPSRLPEIAKGIEERTINTEELTRLIRLEMLHIAQSLDSSANFSNPDYVKACEIQLAILRSIFTSLIVAGI